MQLPEALINSLTDVKGFDKEAFEDVHASGEQVTSIRINPAKNSMVNGVWSSGDHTPYSPLLTPVPWTQYGYYLSHRPSFTFDPLFHAGCYYVQEASSMFLEQALLQTTDLSKPIKVLDLCAAPGGKSTHIQSLISANSLLVSNEVIKGRANILKNNIVKWGTDNVVVTNNDPKDFSRLENYFDVIVVDAPCSGSGLFRRDEEAMDEWSPNNVALCSQRQKRILADVWPSLKKDGVLIYSTCSYSEQEDEEIIDWVSKELMAESCELTVNPEWNITTVQTNSGGWGYRFWPYAVKGEGFFLSCFRKTTGEDNSFFKIKSKAELATKKELTAIKSWFKESNHVFIQKNNLIYAIPGELINDVNVLLQTLRVQYSGIIVGEMFGDKLVPAHSLATSKYVHEQIPAQELSYEKAIQFLQRKEFASLSTEMGWQLMTYQGHNLGWVKVLQNRINNYYPKELRILKES